MRIPAFNTLQEAFLYCRDMDASLKERLEAFSDATRYLIPGYQEAVDRMVGRLKAYDAGQAAPKPGEPMPPFAMPDEEGHIVTLDDLLSEGPLAMTFHRGHWCPYCRINTRALAEAQAQIALDGAYMAAIMPERQQFAAMFKSEGGMRYPVLTDIDNGYALSLNLAIWVGDEMQRILRIWRPQGSGVSGQPSLGDADPGHLRCRPGWSHHGALHRSLLPKTHDHRGFACRTESCPLTANRPPFRHHTGHSAPLSTP